jgi:hypothetical protein
MKVSALIDLAVSCSDGGGDEDEDELYERTLVGRISPGVFNGAIQLGTPASTHAPVSSCPTMT